MIPIQKIESQTPLSPEEDGFIPPWAEWDFNEWETCTDTDLHAVRNMIRIKTLNYITNYFELFLYIYYFFYYFLSWLYHKKKFPQDIRLC